jgi:hypothetical protein
MAMMTGKERSEHVRRQERDALARPRDPMLVELFVNAGTKVRCTACDGIGRVPAQGYKMPPMVECWDCDGAGWRL